MPLPRPPLRRALPLGALAAIALWSPIAQVTCFADPTQPDAWIEAVDYATERIQPDEALWIAPIWRDVPARSINDRPVFRLRMPQPLEDDLRGLSAVWIVAEHDRFDEAARTLGASSVEARRDTGGVTVARASLPSHVHAARHQHARPHVEHRDCSRARRPGCHRAPDLLAAARHDTLSWAQVPRRDRRADARGGELAAPLLGDSATLRWRDNQGHVARRADGAHSATSHRSDASQRALPTPIPDTVEGERGGYGDRASVGPHRIT